MAGELPKMWHLVVLIFNLSTWVNAAPQVPCYFIFGDSLFDNGNNNALPTKAKANYPPYGIDFPEGPTGRFSNGQNMADILAELLGFDKYIPSFANATDQNILKGVNYASGGAGIRDETAARNLGAVITMNRQLQNHQITTGRIKRILGDNQSVTVYLSKCIHTVGMGSNDYINNYFLPQFYPTSRIYTPQRYASVLMNQYSVQLKTLYNSGARKIALFGLGLIGCTPGSIAMYGTNGSLCVDSINVAVQLFNARLRSLVDELNNNFPDAKFIYINTSGIASTPSQTFTVPNTPCCEVANLTTNNEVLTCIPSGSACTNRAEYLFWDATHPTEAAIRILAGRSYAAQTPDDAYPIDIRSLAQL